MPARYILRQEGILPQIERTLGLGALQPLAFTKADHVDDFTRRPLDGFDYIVVPRKSPACLSHRVDASHSLPPPVAIADARRLTFVHELHSCPSASLNSGSARETTLLIFEKSAGN